MFDRFFHPQPFHCVPAKPARDTECNEIAGRLPVRECRAAEFIHPGLIFKLPPQLWSAINAIQLRQGDLAITRRAPKALLSPGMCMAKNLRIRKDLVVLATGLISPRGWRNCRADSSTIQSPIPSLRTRR